MPAPWPVPAAVDPDTVVNPPFLVNAMPTAVLWRRWGGRAAIGACGLVGTDLLLHLGHGLGQGVFNLTLAGAAVVWLKARSGRNRPGLAPTNLSGWLQRCDDLLEQFQQLEEQPEQAQTQRRQELSALRADLERPRLHLAMAGTTLPAEQCQGTLLQALSGRHQLTLHWGAPLDQGASGWSWPAGLARCDLLLYSLSLPLTAADLRWLEARSPGQQAWVLAQLPAAGADAQTTRLELNQQLPSIPAEQLLLWDGSQGSLIACLAPLNQTLSDQGLNLRQSARLQHAINLHQSWLMELEEVRRQHWRRLLQRTQWLVAAGVLAAPGASLDLLVLTAANGLMLKEMARLWDCPWSLEQLQSAAAELGQAALALGVIEWSTQSLTALLRLHGASWLVGSSLEALSAAYLTRVIGHAMADVLALSAGLSEPNLALIKARAPELINSAAEAEKLDWPAFVEQARQWLSSQSQSRNSTTPAIN